MELYEVTKRNYQRYKFRNISSECNSPRIPRSYTNNRSYTSSGYGISSSSYGISSASYGSKYRNYDTSPSSTNLSTCNRCYRNNGTSYDTYNLRRSTSSNYLSSLSYFDNNKLPTTTTTTPTTPSYLLSPYSVPRWRSKRFEAFSNSSTSSYSTRLL